jgi:hypothetical protein
MQVSLIGSFALLFKAKQLGKKNQPCSEVTVRQPKALELSSGLLA